MPGDLRLFFCLVKCISLVHGEIYEWVKRGLVAVLYDAEALIQCQTQCSGMPVHYHVWLTHCKPPNRLIEHEMY